MTTEEEDHIKQCLRLAAEHPAPFWDGDDDAPLPPPPELPRNRDHQVARLFRLLFGDLLSGHAEPAIDVALLDRCTIREGPWKRKPLAVHPSACREGGGARRHHAPLAPGAAVGARALRLHLVD